MSYIRLTEQDDAGVPTPPANKVNIFVDNVTGEPSMKNDAGTVTTLKGAQGDPGEGIPTGGTAGQVLAKIDGTDYNTEWVDPVDSSPLTTKGDIFTYSTDNARLPAGTNGYVLSADSAETTGLKWVPAPSSADSISKLNNADETKWDNVDGVLTGYSDDGVTSSISMNPATSTITADVFDGEASNAGNLTLAGADNQILEHDGSNWIAGRKITSGTTEPGTPATGDIWLDTSA